MLKRISAVLLAVIMMVSMVCTISVAYADENIANLTVTANKESVKRGEKVTFTVAVETTAINLSGLTIDVEADADLAFESKAAVKTTESIYQPEAGTALAWLTGDGALDFNGAIATYTYTAKADATLGDATFTVSAIEACIDTETDSEDVPELVGAGSKTVAIECAHSYENGEWNQPATGTAKEDAKHYKTCDSADCDEPEYADCQFTQTNVTIHTQDQPGEIEWTCSVCEYVCTTEIPAGHEIVVRYKAADADNGVDGYWEDYCAICDEYVEGYEGAKTPIAAEHPGNDTTDATKWYYKHCAYVKAAGLMTSMGGGKFGPGEQVSRAQIATMLVNLYYGVLGQPIPDYDPNGTTFTDCTTHWGKKQIQAAVNLGIASGVGGGKFDPNGIVTTEQTALMFMKLADKMGKKDTQFGPAGNVTDVSEAATWAQTAVQWAVDQGLMVGSYGKVNPKSTFTRDRMAVLLRSYDIALRGIVEVTE